MTNRQVQMAQGILTHLALLGNNNGQSRAGGNCGTESVLRKSASCLRILHLHALHSSDGS
jgi:hypothetical protein